MKSKENERKKHQAEEKKKYEEQLFLEKEKRPTNWLNSDKRLAAARTDEQTSLLRLIPQE